MFALNTNGFAGVEYVVCQPRPFISFCHCPVENKETQSRRVKRPWEIIADNSAKPVGVGVRLSD
jgi:hypothetical protein